MWTAGDWIDVALTVLMAICCALSVRQTMRETRQRREHAAIVEDVLAGRIDEAALKSRDYLARWVK